MDDRPGLLPLAALFALQIVIIRLGQLLVDLAG